MIGGMEDTPIYDQTTQAQGFNPLAEGTTSTVFPRDFMGTLAHGVGISNDGNVYELTPEQCQQIRAGLVGGYSIGGTR